MITFPLSLAPITSQMAPAPAPPRRFIISRWLLWLLFAVAVLGDPAGAQTRTSSIATTDPSQAFVPTVSNRTGLIAGIIVAVVAAILVSLLAVFFVLWKRRKQKNLVAPVTYELVELLGDYARARYYTFSYSELKDATEDFNPANKLGQGRFGPVYKGTLADGRVVAVRQLPVSSHQDKSQFIAEIASLFAVRHRNLVHLYGCCIEGDKSLLVYEYLVDKRLDQLLFGDGKQLSCYDAGIKVRYPDCHARYMICWGVAMGLRCLHEGSQVRIVHGDLKASNILVRGYTPKISDWGLAKLYDGKKRHISTRGADTIGYLAPECDMHGHFTEKTDIFDFGVLALEIISGRTNSNSDRVSLVEWAWNLHEENREIDLVDPTLHQDDINALTVRLIIGVALLCTQAAPLRPAMSRVFAMLSWEIKVAPVTSRPGLFNRLEL